MNYIELPKFALVAFNTDDDRAEKALLDNYGFKNKQVIGRYKGIDEHSHLVIIKNDRDQEDILALAEIYGQESVLFCRPDRTCYLQLIDKGEMLELGNWKEITEDEADKAEAYTYDPLTDRYYIAS